MSNGRQIFPAHKRNLNKCTAHVLSQRPPTADDLTGATRRHLHRRQKQPRIVQSFFRHPSVSYAA